MYGEGYDMKTLVEWPVPHSIEGILGTMNNELDSTYIKGMLPKLMKPLNNTVIFAYLNTKTKETEFIDIFREEPLKSMKNSFPGVCSFLRQEDEEEGTDWYVQICQHNDANALLWAYKLHGLDVSPSPQLPKGWEKIEEYKGIPLYRYMCEETCFIELITPVIVNSNQKNSHQGKMVGAFITGQFKDGKEPFDFNVTCCSVVAARSRLCDLDNSKMYSFKEKIKLEYEKNRILPQKEYLNGFLRMVYDFSKVLGDRYIDLRNSRSMELQKTMDRVIWEIGKNAHHNNDLENIQSRFSALNNRLVKGLYSLVKAVGFTRIHVSMPVHNLSRIEFSRKPSQVGTFVDRWIDRVKRADSWKPEIDLNSERWSEILNADSDSILLEGKTIGDYESDEAFLIDLEKLFCNIASYSRNNNIDVKSYGFFVFATQRHRDYPLVFFFEDDNPDRKCDKQVIMEVFASTAEKYLSQWNEMFSDYQRFLVEVGAGYIDHELGQIQSGIESLAREAMDSYQPVIEWLKDNKAPKQLQKYVYDTKDFAKDIRTFNKLTELISKHQLSSIFSTEPTFDDFMPYGDVLYELNAIYSPQCSREGKFVIISNLDNVINDPLYSPPMYEDKNLFMIVVNNLFRNAVKYSWPGTHIYVDCKLSKNCTKRIIQVTNYGREITEEDKRMMFEFRTRGSNAASASGMGIGLFLVKYLVENLLGGYVNFSHNRVSTKCVPAFTFFTTEAEDFLPESYEELMDEYIRLRDNKIFQKISSGGHAKTLTRREAFSMINLPTDEFRFVVELPHRRRENKK